MGTHPIFESDFDCLTEWFEIDESQFALFAKSSVVFRVFLCNMLLLASLFGLLSVNGMNNGVARTPPMGWLAWERFRCNTDCKTFPDTCIGERLFLEQAEWLVKDGWRDVGYTLVDIDDCWPLKDRVDGKITADPERFPNGIKYIADKVHKMGLQLGIYGDMGTHTCGYYPGSMGFEKVDADMFASWGIDMLKYDGCYSNETEQEVGYPAMSAALNATGRPMIYAWSWPAYQGGLPPQVNYTLLGEICNLWRNYGDIQDSWDDIVDIATWWGDHSDVLVAAAGPGKWNDPDMLIGGNYALTVNQAQVQFGLWAMMAAPLFLSTDLRTMKPDMRAVLQNTAVIAIDQDPLGIQGRRVLNETDHLIRGMSVWTRPLVNGEFAVAAVNVGTSGKPERVHFTMRQLGLPDRGNKQFVGYQCTDLFDPAHAISTYSMDEPVVLYIPTDSIKMFRCRPFYFQIFRELIFENEDLL